MGLAEVLTVVFVVLKLVGVIAWSWGFVFLPELIAVGLAIVIRIYLYYSIATGNKAIAKYMENQSKHRR